MIRKLAVAVAALPLLATLQTDPVHARFNEHNKDPKTCATTGSAGASSTCTYDVHVPKTGNAISAPWKYKYALNCKVDRYVAGHGWSSVFYQPDSVEGYRPYHQYKKGLKKMHRGCQVDGWDNDRARQMFTCYNNVAAKDLNTTVTLKCTTPAWAVGN